MLCTPKSCATLVPTYVIARGTRRGGGGLVPWVARLFLGEHIITNVVDTTCRGILEYTSICNGVSVMVANFR